MNESWLPVPGYEGYYEVSSMGNFRNSKKESHLYGRTLKHHPHPAGYRQVRLKRDGKGHTYTVHRIVATAFLGPAPTVDSVVMHLDDDKTNNNVENLKWGTFSQNTQQYVATGNYKNQNTQKTHCIHGHEFTEINTYYARGRPGSNGERHCRTCKSERRKNVPHGD